ncbi:MAG: PLP-dependent lyase/thiolase [Actinomycetota bacterium]|nr:PLP-dependent lyase/thiolase [Actinomycetota bacterium]
MRAGVRPLFGGRSVVDGTNDPLLWRGRAEPVLRCAGCGAGAATGDPWPWACPQRRTGDDIDHVIIPHLDLAGVPLVMSASANPFVRYRGRLLSYHLWIGVGRDDQSFVALVEALDAAVARVAGHGLAVTPLGHFPDLDEAVGVRVWVKDETGNVAGSHKGRHLFGTLLLLRVLEALGHDVAGDLVIASCGNAARAAAVMAAAGGRHLVAFVPADADPRVMEQLAVLGAGVEVCRRDGRSGDPCYRRFRRAVADGAIPFSCQGPDNGFAIEGASTIAWEVAEALPAGIDRVVLQVGGGALASACVRGFTVLPRAPVIDTVQTAGAHPLARALGRLRERVAGFLSVEEVLEDAAHHRSRYMWPWETEPVSVARGILDDETYDWLDVARAMLTTGGLAVVADEDRLEEANALARRATGIDVDETGSAGLAGLLLLARGGHVPPGSEVLVIFTGGREPGSPDRAT